MNELATWMERQQGREASIVRLEDALLGDRFARYFFYRLRYLLARAAISTALHATKVILLLGVFPRSEFLVIVIAQAVVALFADFWWGALERLRANVRVLQRRGQRHLIPREIGGWLTLSAGLAVAVGTVTSIYALARLANGGLGPAEAIVIALLIGAALDLVARTYHSGAYALRRVYRPLPSLLALDIVSVGGLLLLYPIIGIWAFPVAELASVLVVAAISLWYTSRTYRSLALPTIAPLLRMRTYATPRLRLRGAFAPGIANAFVGLEGIVVIVGIATSATTAGTSLVVLLAAIAPLTRASFEWARLLYFDLKRLGTPLLAGMRRRFDRAVIRLALVIGVAAGALAAVVSAVIVPAVTTLLVVALIVLFTVRSVLAAIQMQAFTRPAYGRLVLAGGAGTIAILLGLAAPLEPDVRLLAVAAALGLSILLLLALPAGTADEDAVLALPDWLTRLRLARGPVTVTVLDFDERLNARGTTAEARRAEAWRRRNVATRLGNALTRRGGAAAWARPTRLWTFEQSASAAERRSDRLTHGLGGLIQAVPQIQTWPDGGDAARTLADVVTGAEAASMLPTIPEMVAEFTRRFPAGICYLIGASPPRDLAQMSSRERVEIYRAALSFVRDARSGRRPQRRDVSGIVEDARMTVIFVAGVRSAGNSAAAHRDWQHLVRDWNLRAAAGHRIGPAAAASVEPEGNGNARGATGQDKDASTQEVAML